MSEANAAEKRRWNEDSWVEAWPKREALTDSVTPFLLEALAPTPGERVLDVGCGGGQATLAVARLVGPTGSVVGADLSAGLTRLAARRAADAGIEHASFVVADVQEEALPDAPFDAVMSQFGVMFFDEPSKAFANIHAQLGPGGRIAFACWQTVERNPWHVGTALAGIAPPVPAPEPGKSQGGPFALGDPERTQAILEGAGFMNARGTPHEIAVEVPVDALVDTAQLTRFGIPDAELDAAQAVVDAHVDRFRIGPDLVKLPLAFQIFRATAS